MMENFEFQLDHSLTECPICFSTSLLDLLDRRYMWPTRVGAYELKHKDQLCCDCGFVFSKIIPSEKYISSYYKNAFFYDEPINLDFDPGKRTDFIRDIFSPHMKILEIGSNNGSYLNYLKKNGFSYVQGIDYLDDSTEKTFIPNHFDGLLMYYTFEHVLNPKSFVKRLCDLVSENGCIVIEVPDFEEYPVESLNHEHFFHYTPYHLMRLFGEFGFKVIKFNRTDKSRYFGFVMAFQKGSRNNINLEANPKTNLQKYFHKIEFEFEKRKGFAQIEKKVLKHKVQTLGIWGMNENATDLGVFFNQKVHLVPIDSNPQKIGLTHLGFSRATVSPKTLVATENVDAIYIAAIAFKEEIRKSILNIFGEKSPQIINEQ